METVVLKKIREKTYEEKTTGIWIVGYLGDDGLSGEEATFALCSFWMVDNLAVAGQPDEARALFGLTNVLVAFGGGSAALQAIDCGPCRHALGAPLRRFRPCSFVVECGE